VPTETGYDTTNAAGIDTITDFAPSGVECAAGYTGAVTYTACDDDANAYTLGGCTLTPTDCIAPASTVGYDTTAIGTVTLDAAAFAISGTVACDTGSSYTGSAVAGPCTAAGQPYTLTGCLAPTVVLTPTPPPTVAADTPAPTATPASTAAAAACEDETVDVDNIVTGTCAYHINWAKQTGMEQDPSYYVLTPDLDFNSSFADFQCALYNAEGETHANSEETHHCPRPCTSTFEACAAPTTTIITTTAAPSSSSMPVWAWVLIALIAVAAVVAAAYMVMSKEKPKKKKRALAKKEVKKEEPPPPVRVVYTTHHPVQTQAVPMVYAHPQTMVAQHMVVAAPQQLVHAAPVATFAAPQPYYQ